MEGVCPETTKWPTQADRPPLGVAIANLARTQHGIVTLPQLVELGLAPSSVRSRVATGQLHRMYRGVYAVGHRILPREGHWLAAVLACGEGAVLSHRSAAALWGIRPTSQTRIDVTSPRRAGKSLEGIHVHSGATLLPGDVTEVEGVPCTSLVRTLLDLAEILSPGALERAIHQALVLGIFDGRAVEDVLGRAGGRRGAPLLEQMLSEGDFTGPGTRSPLEERCLELFGAYGIPRPEVNARLETNDGWIEVDFLWRRQRLVVEANGFRYHANGYQFERDHEREQLLALADWRLRRFTWRQVTQKPALVAEVVRQALAEGRR